MPDPTPSQPPVPEARAIAPKKTRLSLVWIVPIVAALAGGWVAVTRILSEGPKITIVFQSAEGLEAGKTKIQFNGVDIGTITTIRLSDDHRNVVTTAQMSPKTEGFLVDDTSFWVVRPRISGANVSGLGTLISGAYIGMDIGESKTSRRDFTALETPPVVGSDAAGRYFQLKAPDLGSLDTGTPIYFRRLQVGEVAAYKLDEDGTSLDVKVFVKAPYDQFVTPDTRFWQASGIDVSLSASGLSVQTQSLLSILIGGVAFETPVSGAALQPAGAGSLFTLYADRAAAFKLPSRDPQTFLLVFTESVRGLAPGAPVEFQGIQVGEVASVSAQLDAKTFEFSVPVTIHLDAQQLGVKVLDVAPGTDLKAMHRELVDRMVSHGVRAQLRTGNLLTGALYVALDFFPGAAPVTIDWAQTPVQLPTIPGELEALEANVASIIKKVDKLPFQQIGQDLTKVLRGVDTSLSDFDKTLATTRTTLENANQMIEPNSVLGEQLGTTLQEVNRAARSLRVLTDFLERHPEALIRGKAGEAN